ncbi:MAG: hypothetical protein IKZ60_00155 [Bacteroidales bacterium]|nr:hypothetical protein [Bacteroidales bacterium]
MRLSRFIFALMFSATLSFGAAAESVRVVTDKSVYVAGDLIWCSAFCMEGESLSGASAVAYVELISSDGIAATAKIALISGRGCGVISLPATIPTGNYLLLAYTSASEVAEGEIITVFNTMSGARVKQGVTLCEDALPEAKGELTVKAPLKVTSDSVDGKTMLHLRGVSNSDVTAAVSVFEEDGLRAPESGGVSVPLAAGEAEKDGEIIRASIYGKDSGKLLDSPWLTAVISAPGSAADTYMGKIDADGVITFKTNNIYGDRDLVCEILALDNEALDCHFSPISPFVLPEHPDIPSLRLSPSMREALTARHLCLKSSVKVDTLYEFLPKRDNLLLSSADAVSYHLDDYTRFDTIEDIIIELIPEVSVQKIRGRKQLRMGVEDLTAHSRSLNVLALLDGVPVSNHARLLAFDALALSDVVVYPYMYALGNTVFSGVVNFVTAKKDMSALQFSNNVRIVDFRGCSYPVALKTPAVTDGTAAGRTLFWQPMITIPAGGQIDIEVPGTDAPWSARIFGYSAE